MWYAIRCSLGLPRSFSCCMLYSCFTSVFGSSCVARVARLGWLGVANVAPLTARLFASKRQLRPSVWACSQHAITCHYMPLHTITYHYMPLHAITCHYMPLHNITYHYISLHTITCHYIPLHTITYHDIPRHTMTYHYIP